MYQKAYYLLFNAITDALHALDECNYGTARQQLMAAQQAAEDLFLQEESSHEES